MSKVTPQQTLDMVRAGVDSIHEVEPTSSKPTTKEVVVMRGWQHRESQMDSMKRNLLDMQPSAPVKSDGEDI